MRKKKDNRPTRDARGRWMKGHCPNPKGRPKKKAQPYYDPGDVRLFSRAEISVVAGGQTQIMERRAALLHKLYEDAMKGKVTAQRLLLNEFEKWDKRLAADTGRQLAYDKGLAWFVSLPDSGPWVWGDRTRLRQVVLNLVSNAVKFTAQGHVGLSLESGPDAVTVSVTDTGLGVPLEEQPAIFDDFRQSERSAARGYGYACT